MGFAMFNVFFFLTGALILQLLRLSGVHMDLVSFCFLLFNFSVRPAGQPAGRNRVFKKKRNRVYQLCPDAKP